MNNTSDKIIKSTNHYFTNDINIGKQNILLIFLSEYRKVVTFYIDFIWNNKINYNVNGIVKTLDIQNKIYEYPKYCPAIFIYNSYLSMRALKCAQNQALNCIKKIIAKKKKYQYVRGKLILLGQDTSKIDKKIASIKISAPKLNDNFGAEINAHCCEFIEEQQNKYFNGFINLFYLFKKHTKYYNKDILIPIKYTKISNKYKSKGILKKSFSISEKSVKLIWEYDRRLPKIIGNIIGADTGLNTVVSLSDGQQTREDIHGHNLSTIVDKLCRKKKGSVAFKKASAHRANYVNWSINQLNFSNIKQINLEKITNFGFGDGSKSKRSRYWKNSLIQEKLISSAIEQGVLVQFEESFYMSQRCFQCGFVSKKNRKKDKFLCMNCKHSNQADLNAAQNHTVNLPPTFSLKDVLKIKKQFFFQKNGFFEENGVEITVPLDTNKKY